MVFYSKYNGRMGRYKKHLFFLPRLQHIQSLSKSECDTWIVSLVRAKDKGKRAERGREERKGKEKKN